MTIKYPHWVGQTYTSPETVFQMIVAVEQAMLDEAIPKDRREAVVNRLIYGDRRGFIPMEERP